jgi:hypothetical protein
MFFLTVLFISLKKQPEKFNRLCSLYTYQISTVKGRVACIVASVTCYGVAKRSTAVWADAVGGEMSGQKNLYVAVELCWSLLVSVYIQINCSNIHSYHRITLHIVYLYVSI